MSSRRVKSVEQPRAISTQEFLEIHSIQNGMVRWSDNSFSMVIRVGTLNVALQGIEGRLRLMRLYRVHVDSLQFPVQVLVRKTIHTMEAFSAYLQERADTEMHDPNGNPQLLRIISDYQRFVLELEREGARFFEEEFYMVVSDNTFVDSAVLHRSWMTSLMSLLGRLIPIGARSPSSSLRPLRPDEIAAVRSRLTARVETIQRTLEGMGLSCVPLNDRELLRLFFSIFAPDEYTRRRLNATIDEHIAAYLRLSASGQQKLSEAR
jgi:hypothetical protein